jgi:hypothetical protein
MIECTPNTFPEIFVLHITYLVIALAVGLLAGSLLR